MKVVLSRARVALVLALVAPAVWAGSGPAWIIKSRNLKFVDVFSELWTWVQSTWNDVLPMIVVFCVLACVAALIKMARGRHEGHQGGIGHVVLALVGALFAVGIIG